MIYPQKNRLIRWFFHHYILNLVKRNFRQVKYNTVQTDSERSVLLLANHFSWWDGFIMYYINHALFKKNFHVMVIEETVKKVSFIKYMGAFSVTKNSRDILTSLDYAADLLSDPANLVLIFPQGKLHSNFVDAVNFEKGLLRIMQKSACKCQAIMAAAFIETLQYKKPGINVYLNNKGHNIQIQNINSLQEVYQQHYNHARQQQTQIVI